jgi:hypothetical protein
MENIEKLGKKLDRIRQIDRGIKLLTKLAQEVAEDHCETVVVLEIFNKYQAEQKEKNLTFDEDGSIQDPSQNNQTSSTGSFLEIVFGGSLPSEKEKQKFTETLPLTPVLTLKILQLYLQELEKERKSLIEEVKDIQYKL